MGEEMVAVIGEAPEEQQGPLGMMESEI